MGKAQKDRGTRGEILWRDECHKAGFENVQRGGQLPYQKGGELADVIGLYGIHQEVKFTERLNVRQAVEQSIRDCQAGEYPIVAHKTARKEFLVTMRAGDWFKLYGAWLEKQPPEAVESSQVADCMALFGKNIWCWRKAGFPESKK